jgi:hypothetical protein
MWQTCGREVCASKRLGKTPPGARQLPLGRKVVSQFGSSRAIALTNMSNPAMKSITRPTFETGLVREREKMSYLPPFAKKAPAIIKRLNAIKKTFISRSISLLSQKRYFF